MRMRQEAVQLTGSRSASRHLWEGRRPLRNTFDAAGPDHMASGAPAPGKHRSPGCIGTRRRCKGDEQNCYEDSISERSSVHWDVPFGRNSRIATARKTIFDTGVLLQARCGDGGPPRPPVADRIRSLLRFLAIRSAWKAERASRREARSVPAF